MFDVIILLGGIGERCHLPYNKIFHNINGKALFKYSLEVFLKSDANRIILVIKDSEKERLQLELNEYSIEEKRRIVITSSGEKRQDSVYQGMKEVKADYVLIHDGARPNITINDIKNVYNEAKKYLAALLVRRVSDTIKEETNGSVKTLNRDYLWIAETPQAVKAEIFKKALDNAKTDNYYGTDDVMLLEKYAGIDCKLVLSSAYNIKITTKEDFIVFETMLKNTH